MVSEILGAARASRPRCCVHVLKLQSGDRKQTVDRYKESYRCECLSSFRVSRRKSSGWRRVTRSLVVSMLVDVNGLSLRWRVGNEA